MLLSLRSLWNESNILLTLSFNRTTRESTPCSLIRRPEIITTPGSSTKLNICVSESNQREESLSRSHRCLPTTPEMDEFFSGAEEEQQKHFIEKYEFLSFDLFCSAVTMPFAYEFPLWSVLFCSAVSKLFWFCASLMVSINSFFRYNFDPVNEQPLPGRFEWTKVDD